MRVFLAMLSLSLAACLSSTGIEQRECGDGMQMQLEVQPAGGFVDVLVVVDNSMSMAEEQEMLARAFPHLIRSLLDPTAEHVPATSLHVGVVSTDMGTGGYSVETCSDPIDGDGGELQHTPNPRVDGCDETYPTYLASSWEDPSSSVEWMSTGFGCIARLGIDGCGFEQQLKAAQAALIGQRERANIGLLRHGSTLAVVFVTDEEDCSVNPGDEGIFDTLDSSLGHLGLRCYHHPYLLRTVEHYVETYGSLRESHAHVLLGFIVGVPMGEQCEGTGDTITTCLDHPDMQERVDPVSMTRLVPSCSTESGYAFPPRRMVGIAQAFGSDAFVSSICTDDLMPPVAQMTDMIHEKIDGTRFMVPLPVEKDPDDPSLCRASCTFHEMPSPERCPVEGTDYWVCPGGCDVIVVDGIERYRCAVDQVATRISAPSLDCDDPRAEHVPVDGAGWVYLPSTPSGPRIFLAGGSSLTPGSTAEVSCCF